MPYKDGVRTVVLPWYEKGDFASFEPPMDSEELEHFYGRWRMTAQAVLNRHLAEGYAVELVSVEANDFHQWLRQRRKDDSPTSRIEFITQLSERCVGLKCAGSKQ